MARLAEKVESPTRFRIQEGRTISFSNADRRGIQRKCHNRKAVAGNSLKHGNVFRTEFKRHRFRSRKAQHTSCGRPGIKTAKQVRMRAMTSGSLRLVCLTAGAEIRQRRSPEAAAR